VLAVGLALLASACWGVADFIAGLTSRRLAALLVLLVQQAVGGVIVAVVVLAAGEEPPGDRAIVLSVLAGVAGAVALGAFYRGLAVGTMSVVAPISASGVTLPVAFGIATGDEVGALVAVGLVLTIAGVVLASRERDEHGAPAASRASIGLALVAAAGFGAFFTLSDGAADDSVLWLLLISRTTAVILLALVIAATRTQPQVPRARDLWTLSLVGVLDLAATGLYAVANTEGMLSVVAVVGSLYPVATVLLARAILGERLRAAQLAGVVLAFAGIGVVIAGT
jgi:drug/metabolite transporter (DMT)-like permease